MRHVTERRWTFSLDLASETLFASNNVGRSIGGVETQPQQQQQLQDRGYAEREIPEGRIVG